MFCNANAVDIVFGQKRLKKKRNSVAMLLSVTIRKLPDGKQNTFELLIDNDTYRGVSDSRET